MCLLCEEEDLYFLYLEQRERAETRARGEMSAPNPHWLWPTFATPANATGPVRPADKLSAGATAGFICDTPE